MARRRMSPDLVRWLGGLLASVLMVAAVSGLIAILDPRIPALHLLVLYMLVILPVAIVWGRALTAVAAVLSIVVYAYLFIRTGPASEVDGWRASVPLGVFLVTAIVVGELAARLRRAALASARLSAEQAALRRVATLIARGVPPADVFKAVAEELANEFGASMSTVLRIGDDGTATVVGSGGEQRAHIPVGTRLKDAEHGVAGSVLETSVAAKTERFDGPPGSVARFFQDLGATIGVISPIVVEGHPWGIAVAASRKPDAFPADNERRIADFTELVATAIANAEAQTQLMESRARVIASADETRRRIERDLHDGAQQRLVSLALQLRAVQAAVPPEVGQLGAELERVSAGLASTMDELREYARGIHPAILAEGGLGPALKSLARRCPIPVALDVRTEGRLPGQVEVGAYYIVSEALTNAAKHASASEVVVSVEAITSVLRVSVHDDGTGGADFSRGTGLLGLKDRVGALGGRISLHSPREAGTTLRADLPLTNPEGVTPADLRSSFR
ncbi:MAG: sensor histidine kinase [Frankiaceae bacterium]